MSILDLPIPPRPDYFGPDGAPPGVRVMLDVYGTWPATRPTITPRVGIVHTNAASVEASVQSSINYGNAGANNTKPHYLVAEPFSAKVLRTDLRGIANSTGSTIEDLYGEQDCSFWTYAIETADTGINADPAVSDFLEPGGSRHGPVEVPHAELVARIFAYESIVWDHPLIVPDVWNGTGIVTHTWPFPYPHYTIQRGKTCPGTKKIATFQTEILPRAQMIREAWTAKPGPPETLPEDDPMLVIRIDGYADQFVAIPIDNPNARRKMGIPDTQPPVIVQADRLEVEAQIPYKLSPLG